MLRIRSRTGFANPALGTFAVDDQKLIGLPENPPALPVEIVLQVNGQELRYLVDTKYRTVDPVAGEVRSPVVILPPVFVNVPNSVFVFPTNERRPVSARYGSQWSCERRT